MSRSRLLSEADTWIQLAESLDQIPEVKQYDQNGEKGAENLVHGLADLEESFVRITEELLPGLLDRQGECGAVHELLLELGEEFRHILYHLKDLRFYSYLDTR